MRERYCRSCGGWHQLEKWPHNCLPEQRGAPSDAIPVPSVISDSMAPVKSMADGRYYDSKSAIRAGYKAGGFVEIGNDTPKPKPASRPDPRAINDAVERAVARVERGERKTA